MAWTQYSQPVQRPDYYKPISDEALLLGAKQQYETAYKTGQIIGMADKMFGVQTYGKDAEVLQQIHSDFQKEIAQLSQGSFSDPANISKINTVIGRYANDPDLMNISKRANFLQSEQKKKQEAEEKGLPFYSRGYEDLTKYYNSGVYYRSPKNVNLTSGFIGVNLSKARNEALKDVPKEKYLKNGRYYERYNQDALNQALNTFYTDPRVQKQILYDVENKWKDKDWATEGVSQITAYKEAAQKDYNEAMKLGRQDLATEYMNDINMYDKMLQDPTGYGEQIKSTVYNQELQNRIETDKQHANFNSVEKADEYYMKQVDLANTKAAKLYDMQLKTGITRQPNESEASFMGRLAQGAYEKDIEIAKAKQEIKTEAQLEIEAKRQEGKEKLAKMKFDQALSKVSKGQKTAATKAITNLAQDALDWEDDGTIVDSMIRQNIDKFIKEFKKRNPGQDVVSGFDPDDIEKIKRDPESGNIVIEFDVDGFDSFFGLGDRDLLSLTQKEVAEILQDEPKETTALNETEWQSKWDSLKPGESMIGLDGITYTKQ